MVEKSLSNKRQSTIFEFMNPSEYNESMINTIGYFWNGKRLVPYAGGATDYKLVLNLRKVYI